MLCMPQNSILQVSLNFTMHLPRSGSDLTRRLLNYSADCSKAHWPEHKSKCMSEKNINAILDRFNAELEAKPVSRPSSKKCTGCGQRFDEDEYPVDEACDECGRRFSIVYVCEDGLICQCLGYMACESCSCDYNNGMQCGKVLRRSWKLTDFSHFIVGSCYCQNSNFGYPYCERGEGPYFLLSVPDVLTFS